MGMISKPLPINYSHYLDDFDCGNDTLNHWLQLSALGNDDNHGSRTFVVCAENVVVGYYSLATGNINRSDAPGNLKRKMPNPIPIILIGRLAVEKAWQGKGIGSGLLKDALLRVLMVSEQVGVKAVIVHPIDDFAREFYLSYGFKVCRDTSLAYGVSDIKNYYKSLQQD